MAPQTVTTPFPLEDSFARTVEELVVPWQGAEAPAPRLVLLNEDLARELGADPDALRRPEGLALLTSGAGAGVEPVAMAYAGHQFGGYSPRLGDGRALLVGEVVDRDGSRRDLHLKGSGRTPFARGGDGKAVLGPMLREFVVSEAMHALDIPTTRSLAVVATGEEVARETLLPGAVLARVASSHIRVGTFQYASSLADPTVLRRLADHTIDRHHPEARDAARPYLDLLTRITAVQAALVARWMLVGFVHGVMNTDNVTVSGETIDYGPCAFMDAYDPATVFSSIDHGGRYAYGNQPVMAQWALARLAEALLPLIDDDVDAAVALAVPVLDGFADAYDAAHADGLRAKIGLSDVRPGDDSLLVDLKAVLRADGPDWTGWFRALAADLRDASDPSDGVRSMAVAHRDGRAPSADATAWLIRWRDRVLVDGADPVSVADAMDRVNPVYVPRNHLVEEVLAAATAGDEGPLHRLLDVLARPFDERPGLERYAAPGPVDGPPFRTFCGT